MSDDKNIVGEEIMDPKSKDEMKKRLKYQVKCGTFIEPKYKKRIQGCGTKADMRLRKPIDEKLNDIRFKKPNDLPKPIRDVYNELVDNKVNSNTQDVCQNVQNGVSMKASTTGFDIIGDETQELSNNIYANDSSFDPYSNFN